MLLEKVEQTIHKFRMLEPGDKLVVAVSGGPDSCALVYLLNRLKKKLSLYLHLAHLNHLLRKKEAERDSAFVQALAKKLGLPLTCEQIRVKDLAQKGKLCLEEAARRARYDFLIGVAKQNSAFKIALGHNRDDQAETVLMRFLRGSGAAGLCGMPAKREVDGCIIIRPLIEVKRTEILHFLSAKKAAFCTDSTNKKNFYLRNRIRNQLIPLLEKNYNPNLSEMLINFAENIADDFDYLQRDAKKQFIAVRANSVQPEIALRHREFSLLHKAMQKLVARLAIKELKGDVRRIDYRHWKELEDLTQYRPENSIVDLPGEISIVKQADQLVFYKRDRNSSCQKH